MSLNFRCRFPPIAKPSPAGGSCSANPPSSTASPSPAPMERPSASKPSSASSTATPPPRTVSGGQTPPKDRAGGLGPGHAMNIPRWVDEVGQLFPREAKEVIERELVNRRGLRELMEKPELLEKIEPNKELVKTLLTHRDLLNEKTRSLARKVIEKVVERTEGKNEGPQVEAAITGAIRRDKHSPRRVFRNLDLGRTDPPQSQELRPRLAANSWSSGSTISPPSERTGRGTSSSPSINPDRCSTRRSSPP